MGASNSRLEDDKSLLLCRERKKFIKQALNGRCSLAAAHIAYIEELKIIGTALRIFIETDAQPEPGPWDLTEKSASQLSSSSRSSSQDVVSPANISPSPSIIPPSSKYQLDHMKSRGKLSRKVEEKLPEPVTFSVSANTPLSTTPQSTDSSEPSLAETTPWDYFGLFNPVDDHFSSQDGPMNITELERDGDDMFSLDGIDESQGSEDEFDEPSSATLVRSFKNVNVVGVENAKEMKENLVDGDSKSENKVGNGTKKNSPDLSPLRGPSSRFVQLNDVKITPMEQSQVEDKAAPKDFVSSLKDIEQLFVKASESGIEVPLMLEANKFHFRPVFRGERGLISSALLKSCFSCGDDPSEARQGIEEPAQNSVKYLTWHRSTSFRSGSYRNLLSANSTGDAGNNLFDNFCMVSGSHASTLDRLYAWEKKLYDEVKAVQVLRSHFDHKCKVLGQQESRGENTDKTRARVKDLHSRIGVAIHRINSISKKIEEIRDKELQPQLEELIQGLRKMWEQMMECHKLQFHIVSISQAPGGAKITIQTNSRKQTTVLLGNKLSSLSSTFTKWIVAQRLYVESIEKWLVKCVWLQQTTSKRNKRIKPPPLRNLGPPIYMICGAWLEMIDNLPAKEVTDSIKDLADQVTHFHKESSEGGTKGGDHDGVSLLASEDWVPVLDRFQTSLMGFLGQLNNFAESSAKMFVDLQEAIQQAKNNYELYKSQRGLGKILERVYR